MPYVRTYFLLFLSYKAHSSSQIPSKKVITEQVWALHLLFPTIPHYSLRQMVFFFFSAKKLRLWNFIKFFKIKKFDKRIIKDFS